MNATANNDTRASSNTALSPLDIVRLFRTHALWCIAPAIVCAVIAAVYTLFAGREWQATQALIVRPDAAGLPEERVGKFSDLSEMKTLQETILELAKSRRVLQATLREVGPPVGYRRIAQWPSALDVADFREAIDMRPPGGAEFGTTEVFYLAVRDTNRQRASVLVVALCKQLEQRLQEIRDQRARGMVAELERTVALADQDLASRTSTLAAFEAAIGADLAELRNLNAEVGSQSEVSLQLQAIESERRANESQQRENVRLLKLLQAAQDDPQQLLATPNSLLQSQPAVAQLKSSLIAAEVRTANLLGSRVESHPFVMAAREAEQRIRTKLHDEIAVAIRGLQVDIELNVEREQVLTAKWEAARNRSARLANSRAEYAKLVESVENHTRLVESARKTLADARARQAGAVSASVISRIDGVDAGTHPLGVGRTTVTAAGGFGGLMLGFGLVFLFASPAYTFSARTCDESRNQVNEVLRTEIDEQGQGLGNRLNGVDVWRKNGTQTLAPTYDDSSYVSRHKNEQADKKHASAVETYHGMTLEEALRGVESKQRHAGF